ncbi:hypothetical protein IU451_28700 [Nocardia cyriacigeorgica]|uniref:hypothetical protein n=1 Tax=Nocardia cyriacigeorgica TaxID=135487 RepID=UPI001895A50A|nr:hypothetical protein [Nocardia cyriacigeorgica]MBF6326482.1 hypothetical protein [Nocardia cyriacigeorgica]
MSGDRDIVDEIDALVDWQLDQYERRSGYDFNVNQAECPHSWCGEDWHSLPIKQRMREIRRLWQRTVVYYGDQQRVPEHVTAELDAYRYDQDDSAIICPGSAFEGEFEPPAPTPIAWDAALDPILRAQRMLGEMQDLVIRISGVPPVWDIPDDPLVDQEPGQGLWQTSTITWDDAWVPACWWRRDGVREFEIRPRARPEQEIAASLNRAEGSVEAPTVIVDGVEIATVRDSERDAAFIVHAAPDSDDSWVEVFTRGCPGPGWRRIDPDRPACDGRHVHWAAELPEGPAELSFPNPPRFVSSGEVMIAQLGTDPTDLSQFRPLGFIDETEAPVFSAALSEAAEAAVDLPTIRQGADSRRRGVDPRRPWVRDRTFDRRGRRR